MRWIDEATEVTPEEWDRVLTACQAHVVRFGQAPTILQLPDRQILLRPERRAVLVPPRPRPEPLVFDWCTAMAGRLRIMPLMGSWDVSIDVAEPMRARTVVDQSGGHGRDGRPMMYAKDSPPPLWALKHTPWIMDVYFSRDCALILANGEARYQGRLAAVRSRIAQSQTTPIV